jgi:hypothetical protein
MSKPMNRRGALGAVFAAGAALAAPRAAHAAESDAELLALSDEILRRCAEAEQFQETRIMPHEDRFQDIIRDESKAWAVRRAEADALDVETGRSGLIIEQQAFGEATDGLFRRLMAIPATTQAGRAAKVRALLAHVLGSDWQGPEKEIDWDKRTVRSLLGEFAGMRAAELEAI